MWVKPDRKATLARYLSHLTILLLVAIAIRLDGFQLPQVQNPASPLEATGGASSPNFRWPDRASVRDYLVKAPVPITTIPERPRKDIITYVVQSGDTIISIAENFGISPDTVLWANGQRLEDNPDLLMVGQELIILPVSGVYHTVVEGDTLESIAEKYKVDVSAITELEHNKMEEPYEITPGQKLIVPGGEKPYVPRVVQIYSGPIPEGAARGTGVFGWPVSGQITQKFWQRHRAIDIGTYQGAPVIAADSGYVIFAGWNESGYGRVVFINHGNGFITVYAHMQVLYVEEGQSVKKGQQIGKVGATGRATGPHLHFEIRKNGKLRNPFGFLP